MKMQKRYWSDNEMRESKKAPAKKIYLSCPTEPPSYEVLLLGKCKRYALKS